MSFRKMVDQAQRIAVDTYCLKYVHVLFHSLQYISYQILKHKEKKWKKSRKFVFMSHHKPLQQCSSHNTGSKQNCKKFATVNENKLCSPSCPSPFCPCLESLSIINVLLVYKNCTCYIYRIPQNQCGVSSLCKKQKQNN